MAIGTDNSRRRLRGNRTDLRARFCRELGQCYRKLLVKPGLTRVLCKSRISVRILELVASTLLLEVVTSSIGSPGNLAHLDVIHRLVAPESILSVVYRIMRNSVA